MLLFRFTFKLRIMLIERDKEEKKENNKKYHKQNTHFILLHP